MVLANFRSGMSRQILVRMKRESVAAKRDPSDTFQDDQLECNSCISLPLLQSLSPVLTVAGIVPSGKVPLTPQEM